MVFKSLNGLAPDYLYDMFSMYNPSRSLGSSGTGLLTVPRVRNKNNVEAAISVYGPRLWNSLPEELRESKSVNNFKVNLKT